MPDATDILNALVLMTNFVFVPALAYGSQLALGALGVTLVFGILRFANFAHGDLMAFGTTIVILITWGLQAQGITAGPVPTALIALVPAFAAVITRRFIRREEAWLAARDSGEAVASLQEQGVLNADAQTVVVVVREEWSLRGMMDDDDDDD